MAHTADLDLVFCICFISVRADRRSQTGNPLSLQRESYNRWRHPAMTHPLVSTVELSLRQNHRN